MDCRWSWFLSVLHILFSSVQMCEIPGGSLQHVDALNIELLKLTEDVSEAPNPSVYLALRLSDEHSLQRENRYLRRLKDAFQPNDSSPTAVVHYHQHPGTGQLALYLLSLRAACQNMESPEGNQLVTQMKLHLHKEQKEIGHEGDGHPITNYYQYGLGLLALCVHEKKVDNHVIHKLLHAEEHGKLQHNNKLSVDTEAMAGLAFACLERARFYTPELVAKLNHSRQRVKQKILQSQTSNGAFGNIYSTPLAVQFLLASGINRKRPECVKVGQALIQSLERGAFRNPLTQSQLLPVLYGKSYLDIAGKECRAERGRREENLAHATASSASRKTSQPRRRIGVQLVVKKPPRSLPLYRQVLYVPSGSTLLDVLNAATQKGREPLTFEMENSLSGPMLVSVMGVKAQEGERKYWKIVRAPNTALDEGIADYIPKDKETIMLRFVPW